MDGVSYPELSGGILEYALTITAVGFILLVALATCVACVYIVRECFLLTHPTSARPDLTKHRPVAARML